MKDINKGFKILTHDFRPPIQGGTPVFDGHTPFTLPITDGKWRETTKIYLAQQLRACQQALRLHLAVAPDDPLLIEPMEKQLISCQEERDRAVEALKELCTPGEQNEHSKG